MNFVQNIKGKGKRKAPLISGGFTLIELLAVVTIMAIILAISTLAFTQIGEAAALRGATNEVRAALALARQNAITKRTQTAFVILDKQFDSANFPTYTNMWGIRGRAYAVVDTQNDTFIRSWKELPANIFFNDLIVPAEGRNIAIFNTRNTSEYRQLIKIRDTDTTKVNVMGILFKPDGKTALGSGVSEPHYHWVILSEGYLDSAGNLQFKAGKKSFGLRTSMAGSIKFFEF